VKRAGQSCVLSAGQAWILGGFGPIGGAIQIFAFLEVYRLKQIDLQDLKSLRNHFQN